MSFNSIQESERAIDALTPQQIDAQLKADLEAGRIDDLIHRALADHKDGNTQSIVIGFRDSAT